MRMGASGPGHSTRGERGGPGQEEARQTSVAGRVRPRKEFGFCGFSGRPWADPPLERKFGFWELAGFSGRSLSDLSVARQSFLSFMCVCYLTTFMSCSFSCS